MDTKDLVARASTGPAFIDLANSGAKDMDEFQEIVKLALAAESEGLLKAVFVHPSKEQERYDLLYLTGATESGRTMLSEP